MADTVSLTLPHSGKPHISHLTQKVISCLDQMLLRPQGKAAFEGQVSVGRETPGGVVRLQEAQGRASVPAAGQALSVLNGRKRARSIWLPPAAGYRREYVTGWVADKMRWGLRWGLSIAFCGSMPPARRFRAFLGYPEGLQVCRNYGESGAQRAKGHVRYLTYSRITPVHGLDQGLAPLIDIGRRDIRPPPPCSRGKHTWARRPEQRRNAQVGVFSGLPSCGRSRNPD
ncbi:hypothetical protein GCM10010345_85000 [Streptomyces canarius]|uniref:Uncharacterized protein n=1 Tax=Streptomyces canarius TaxID=285453 RepID=A0ABQ3DA04_9ACTN|nr:hypothetical protein GCM10010345_85000 [Streptomyces canarius]